MQQPTTHQYTVSGEGQAPEVGHREIFDTWHEYELTKILKLADPEEAIVVCVWWFVRTLDSCQVFPF